MKLFEKEPTVGNQTFASQDFLKRALSPEALGARKEVVFSKIEDIVGRGTGRILNKLTLVMHTTKDFVELHLRRGRGSRGPCPGCEGGGSHNWGSRCKEKRSPGPKMNVLPVMNLTKPIFSSSGLR